VGLCRHAGQQRHHHRDALPGEGRRQAPGKDGDAYRVSFLKGVRYLLVAQFPNGGWPQVWPLEGGYHDAVTFNDNAVSEAADLLTEVSEAKADFAFVPADLRAKSGAAAKKGRASSSPRRSGSAASWPSGASRPTRSPWPRSPAATSSRRPCRRARAPTCWSI
jgi:hypothetical protein